MPREWLLYLDDIQQSIARIRTYTHNFDFDRFLEDKKTQDAVIRNLEIIGEAARLVPQELQSRTSQVEWRKIIGLRNVLAHEYFGINLAIVWDILATKLEVLDQACEQLRDEYPHLNQDEH